MTADQIVDCSYDATAILALCHAAAASIQGTDSIERAVRLGDSIAQSLRLAMELLEPVHDALETHEGIGTAEQ
jgi:hypothetical protein